jgi:hypothetical protein
MNSENTNAYGIDIFVGVSAIWNTITEKKGNIKMALQEIGYEDGRQRELRIVPSVGVWYLQC